MADASKKDSSGSTKVVGSDLTGNETNYWGVDNCGNGLVAETINKEAVQAIINVTGGGVTAFANINNTVGGNLVDRRTLRIYNRGKKIRWRVYTQLTGNEGEDIGKGEAIDFEYGDGIVIEMREQNNDNEIDVIITESK